jgi:hypothetical protein
MNDQKYLEQFNLINYLKIIDVSLLNIFDYLDLGNGSLTLVEQNNKLVLNLNAESKKLLESFVLNNLHNSIYYGKTNILVDTCSPKENWRHLEQILNKKQSKYILNDDSIYIDNISLNVFFSSIFKKMKKNLINFQKSNHKIFFLNFNTIDVYDSFLILNNILSTFGIVNKDNFNYNLIEDGNHDFFHGCEFLDELTENVRLILLKKGII